MSDAPDTFEASRQEKLRRIEALGVDPWGQRFDGHQAIGDIIAYYATYYTSPVKPMPAADTRPAGMSDVEWQIKNWYNFQWLCGDSVVEQAVHSADKIAWSQHDKPPLSCVAVGGRRPDRSEG